MRFAILIEKSKRNWSAYVPDLPGCVATGRTAAAARDRLQDAIRMHIDGMREDGEKLPLPTTVTDYVEV